MKTKAFVLLTSFVLVTILTAGDSMAANGSVQTSLDVSATTIVVCTVAAGQNFAFGNYSINGVVDVDRQGTVNVNCALGTPYNIFVGTGNNPDGSGGRQMILNDGSDLLAYNIYTSWDFSNVWGSDSSGGSSTYYSGTGGGGTQQIVLHGKISAGQNVPIGDYSDVVAVTVEW